MDLGTGDLVLFTASRGLWAPLDWMISRVTRSPYVHVGLVVVDPPFLDARGTFLWEAGYEACANPETGKNNLGVRLTPIAAVPREGAFVRKCTLRIPDARLSKIHADVFLKPYDVCLSDWLLATLRLDAEPQKTSRFWCSAFVAYVLTRLGWLPESTDWSIVRPCDLSSASTFLAWTAPVYLRDTPLPVAGKDRG